MELSVSSDRAVVWGSETAGASEENPVWDEGAVWDERDERAGGDVIRGSRVLTPSVTSDTSQKVIKYQRTEPCYSSN